MKKRRGRKRKMSKEEERMREMAYEIVEGVGFEKAIKLLYEEAMRAERERYKEEHPEDPSNGYYEREVRLLGERERVKVPRTRKGGFRSALLPERWKRDEEVGVRLLEALLRVGYSREKVRTILRRMGIRAREEEIEEFEGRMRGFIEHINTAPIEEDEVVFVYLDGHRLTIRTGDRSHTFTLYVVMGITKEGRKRFLHVEIREGREKSSEWLRILKLLVERGLKKPLMFITDDLTGLDNVIKGLFPKADHQLCLNHLMRAIRRNLPKQEAEDMVGFIKAEKEGSDNKDLTVKKFKEKLLKIQEEHPNLKNYIAYLIQNADNYWAFLSYPRQIRRYIYTTNPIEAVFRQVKVMEHNNMGFFASINHAYFSIAIVLDSISYGWRRPIPIFPSVSYELNQLAAVKYLTQS